MLMSADDGSLPGGLGRGGDGDAEAVSKLLSDRRRFELDRYYPRLMADGETPLTVPSRFLNIAPSLAVVLQSHFAGRAISSEDEEILAAFLKEVNGAVEEMKERSPTKQAFVRLSTRSPKDAVDKGPLIPRTVSLLAEELRNAKPMSDAELRVSSPEVCAHVRAHRGLDPQRVLLAVRRAFFGAMAVHDADQALLLLTYSSRVISDLKRALDYAYVQEWNLNLVVRAFVPMDAQGELRGFVHQGKLTALSQYYCDCYFADLLERREEYREAVNKFFESEVSARLAYLGSYVVDFVVCPRTLDVSVVELNPFSESTGACLFDWTRDHALLRDGPLCMRVLESAPLDNRAHCYLPWKALVDAAWRQIDDEERAQSRGGKRASEEKPG
eukprot:CAMPEP_0174238740 /NCGR_PEP_ID=MMETSP0417-20130205/12287_1 /TAXON_ID=242541 /ORGANISM="Mayorella sp, Strain BSH-02190019" /LENGTH=384 /DNA_ID=CAMNT_0015317615 /DNA_START=15 /DNA_END=1165 /DNA_ORIENTATION=-